jgi:putative transposase
MNYRRARAAGGCYFFTVVTHQRCKLFTSDASVGQLHHAFRLVMNKYPFTIDAIVILPDHLHCIWTLPPGDANFATRWRLIKTHMTKWMSGYGAVRLIRPTGSVWQKRYWEHVIRSDEDFRAHVDYIHYNPVRHRYTNRPADWAWSSFGLYVRRGLLASDWGASDISISQSVGRE